MESRLILRVKPVWYLTSDWVARLSGPMEIGRQESTDSRWAPVDRSSGYGPPAELAKEFNDNVKNYLWEIMKGSFIKHVMLNCWFVMVVECIDSSSELFPDYPKLKHLNFWVTTSMRWLEETTTGITTLLFSQKVKMDLLCAMPYTQVITHLAFNGPFGSTRWQSESNRHPW